MKYLLSIFLFVSFYASGQTLGQFRYDTSKFFKNGGVTVLKVEGAIQPSIYSSTFTTSANAPAIGQSFNLGTISADQTITFLDLESGRSGTFIYVYNSNASAFAWNIAGNVYEGDGTVISSLPKGLHIFNWIGSRWIRLSTSGGSSPTVDTLTFTSPLVQLDKNVSLDFDAFPQDTVGVVNHNDSLFNILYSHTGTRDSTFIVKLTAGGGSGSWDGTIGTSFYISADYTITGTPAVQYSFDGGSPATLTLPALAANANRAIFIKNQGTATLTVASNAASEIWTTAAVSSFSMPVGSGYFVINDGNYWNVYAQSSGSGSVTSVASGYGLSGGPITSTGTLTADTSNQLASKLRLYKVADSLGAIKQATLVSGTNIKTINGASILGSGDLTVSGGANTSDSIRGRYVDTTGLRNGYGIAYNTDNTKFVVQQLNNKETALGIKYNTDTWANTNDFTNTTGTATAGSGKISISGGTGTFTNTLSLKDTSVLTYWKYVMKFTVKIAPGGTTYGVGIGMKSVNTSGLYNALARIDLSSGGGQGTLILNAGSANTSVGTSSTATIANGDTIYLTVERKADSLLAKYWNKTQSVTRDIRYKYDLTSAATVFLPNTGVPTVFRLGGTQEIDSLAFTSTETKNAQLMIVTNSKGMYNAGSWLRTAGAQLNHVFGTTVIHAGGSDKMSDILSTVQEIKALSPKNVLLMDVTSNSQRGAVASATYQAEYQKMVDSLERYGINVYHSTPLYETSINQGSQLGWIRSTFASNKIIDLWSPIASNTSRFLSADGIHPTAEGQDTIVAQIVNAGIIPGYVKRLPSSLTGNYHTKVSPYGGLENSSMYEDGTRMISLLPIEATSTTGTGFAFNKTNNATDTKIWNDYIDASQRHWSVVNDARASQTDFMTVTRSTTTPTLVAFPASPVAVKSATIPATTDFFVQSDITRYAFKANTAVSADYNLEMYAFNTSNFLTSVNTARTTFRDMSILSKDFSVMTDFNSGVGLREIAKFKNNKKILFGDSSYAGAAWHRINMSTSINPDSMATAAATDLIVGIHPTTGMLVKKSLNGSASLDFPSTGSTAVADLTITVTGAAVGDKVALGVPNASITATASFFAWVSATNTVTVRYSPKATEDPASGTFTVEVIK